MPRPLSDSWQYFELLSPDNGRNRKARCTFCGHEQAAGITRLHQHLLYRCSRISADIRDQLRQKQEDRNKTESVSSIRSTDMLQQRHLHHQQPPQQVDYHFDPTLQNTLNHHNSYYETSGTASNSSSNHTMSPTHTHFSTSAPPYPIVTTTNTHHSDSHPTAAFQPAGSSTATNSTTNSLAGGGISTPPTASLSHTTPHPDTANRSQAMLDWQLARALFSANIPFESIENPMMVEFFKRLQPNYVVPKGKRLLQYLLKEQHWDLIRWDNENTTNSAALRLSSSAPSGVRGASMMNHNNTNRLLSSLHSPDLEGNL